MNDFFVDGAAKRVWETQIPFEGRHNLIPCTKIVCVLFKFPGSNPRNNFTSEIFENRTRYAVGFP